MQIKLQTFNRIQYCSNNKLISLAMPGGIYDCFWAAYAMS